MENNSIHTNSFNINLSNSRINLKAIENLPRTKCYQINIGGINYKTLQI